MKKILLLLLCAVVSCAAQARDGHRSAFQFSILPPLGTNGALSPEYTNSVSLNLLAGSARSESSPLRIEIRADDAGISVSNRLQLRSSAERNGFGLDNLRRQYSILGREISVSSDSEEFRVRLPYL